MGERKGRVVEGGGDECDGKKRRGGQLDGNEAVQNMVAADLQPRQEQ